MKIKKIDFKKIISAVVFLSFVFTTGYLLAKIIVPSETTEETLNLKSDYIFLLSQCLIGIICMFLPGFLAKKIRIHIPSTTYLIYVLFLYCTLFLGEIRNFYYSVPHWDTIMHTFSGVIIGALGFSVLSLLNRDQHVTISLSPLFVALFALCFATTVGVTWEIFEFLADSTIGSNMQKFALEDGTLLIGHAALTDTMKDIIVDVLGSLVASVLGYISLKYKHGKFERLFDLIEFDET